MNLDTRLLMVLDTTDSLAKKGRQLPEDDLLACLDYESSTRRRVWALRSLIRWTADLRWKEEVRKLTEIYMPHAPSAVLTVEDSVSKREKTKKKAVAKKPAKKGVQRGQKRRS